MLSTLQPKINFEVENLCHGETLIDNIFSKLTSDTKTITTGVLMNHISDHQPYFMCLDINKTNLRAERFKTITTKSQNFIENVKINIHESDIMSRLDLALGQNPNRNIVILQDQITSSINENTQIKI